MNSTSQSNDKVNSSKVVGSGVVTGVNKPGDGSFQAFALRNGDRVETSKYKPQNDDTEVEITGGEQYDMLMVTQPANNNAQAFIVWWANEPALQKALIYKNTKVSGIGTTNKPICRGDRIEIRTQATEDGYLDVTFDIRRGRKYVATFSFRLDEAKPEQSAEKLPQPTTYHPDPQPPVDPQPPTIPHPDPQPTTPHPDPQPLVDPQPPTIPHPDPQPTTPHPDPQPPVDPQQPPPSAPISFQAQIAIIGASNPPVHYPYIGWAPVRCQIFLRTESAVTDPVQITIRNQNPQNQGGQVVFRRNAADNALDELTLSLVPNGSAVDFYLAGKVGFVMEGGVVRMISHASTNDKDTVIEVVETNNPPIVLSTTPLMVRVRKNANMLMDAERDRFLAAFALLNNPDQLERRKRDGKVPPDTQPFSTFRDMHMSNTSGEAHSNAGFLPWHRAYLLDLERELQKVDPSVSLPYWRFDEPAPNLFTQAFLGIPNDSGMLQFDETNPLKFWATDGQTGIQRQPLFDTQTSTASVIGERETLNLGPTYAVFRVMESDPHGGAHMSFEGFVSGLNTAARDPLFFMLHCNVDRLWAKWQWVNHRYDATSVDTYPYLSAAGSNGAIRVGHNLLDTMWPWNQVMGGERPSTAPGGDFANSPIVAAPSKQPTVGDMIDYQGVRSFANCIGLDYDDVPYEHQA